MGIITAMGAGKEASVQQLLSGKSAIGSMQMLQTKHKDLPVGEVKYTDEELRRLIGMPSEQLCNRTTLLARVALKEALAEAQLNRDFPDKVAFVSGNTVGGMEKSELYYHDFKENNSRNEYIGAHDCGACTEMIAEEYKGNFILTSTISTACSSAANAIILGANLIKDGNAEIAVVGGTECLSKFHLNGFNTLMILDHNICKPFDAQRNGLNLGEGAAYLVIETEESALRRNVPILCELSGYGNSCDAFHQTATSPQGDGPFLAMQKALTSSGLTAKDIDYINAHGTGTPNNDECEGNAMMRIFGDKMPPVSSTKAYTGHTTSAAGSVESVISILSILHHFIPANLNYQQAIEGHHFKPIAKVQTCVTLHHVLTNSFGFGGNDSSCIFSEYQKSGVRGQGSVISNVNSEFKIQNSERKKPVFIQAVSQISNQAPLDERWFEQPEFPVNANSDSQEADYSKYINPMAARRMGKLFKRAIATAVDVMGKGKMEQVDAIITGTGLGCIEHTEKFLNAMLDNDEECLPPTHFMQSTHNTISSQIALHLKCHGYNCTYSHRGTSFDSSLLDALTQMHLGDIHSAMVCGHEEMTPTYFKMLGKIGYWKQDQFDEKTLRRHDSIGSFSGSCSVNLLLSDKANDETMCAVQSMDMLYKPNPKQLQEVLQKRLAQLNISMEDISAVVMGLSGDQANDKLYLDFAQQHCPNTPIVWYKHLFGESYCASAFGVYTAAVMLQRQSIPTHLIYSSSKTNITPKYILVYNHFQNKDHSLILLSSCSC
jgi:3-oxoacyl-(acyl-carrier-protein) synthase